MVAPPSGLSGGGASLISALFARPPTPPPNRNVNIRNKQPSTWAPAPTRRCALDPSARPGLPYCWAPSRPSQLCGSPSPGCHRHNATPSFPFTRTPAGIVRPRSSAPAIRRRLALAHPMCPARGRPHFRRPAPQRRRSRSIHRLPPPPPYLRHHLICVWGGLPIYRRSTREGCCSGRRLTCGRAGALRRRLAASRANGRRLPTRLLLQSRQPQNRHWGGGRMARTRCRRLLMPPASPPRRLPGCAAGGSGPPPPRAPLSRRRLPRPSLLSLPPQLTPTPPTPTPPTARHLIRGGRRCS